MCAYHKELAVTCVGVVWSAALLCVSAWFVINEYFAGVDRQQARFVVETVSHRLSH